MYVCYDLIKAAVVILHKNTG